MFNIFLLTSKTIEELYILYSSSIVLPLILLWGLEKIGAKCAYFSRPLIVLIFSGIQPPRGLLAAPPFRGCAPQVKG